jgi:autotransporter-associated beta strand protein
MPRIATFPRRRWLSTTVLSLALAPCFHVQADSFTWDGDTATGGLQDGVGNWDTTATNRWTNGSYQAWVNSLTTPDSAIFGNGIGAAGTVTMTTAIVAGGLTFNTTGSGSYTIASSAGTSTLTLVDATSPVVTANVNAAISGVLDGTNGFTKMGAGTLTLSGSLPNTLTGTTHVTAGQVTLNKTTGVAALAGEIVIDGGILLWNANNEVSDSASITLTSGALGFNGRSETIKNLSIQGGNANNGGGGNGGVIAITDTLSVSSTGTLGLNSAGQWSAETVAFSGGARTALNLTGNNPSTMTRFTVGAGGLSMTGQTISINKGTTALTLGSELLLNGNVTVTGTNAITIGNSVGSAQVNLGTTVTWEATGATDVMTINPAVVGSGGLTKTGLGAVKLVGTEANTYQGATTVSAGTLNLGKTATVDAIAKDVLVNGGTLDWDIANQLNDGVNITMSSGALKFDSFAETFASLTQTGGSVNPGGGVNGGVVNMSRRAAPST